MATEFKGSLQNRYLPKLEFSSKIIWILSVPIVTFGLFNCPFDITSFAFYSYLIFIGYKELLYIKGCHCLLRKVHATGHEEPRRADLQSNVKHYVCNTAISTGTVQRNKY